MTMVSCSLNYHVFVFSLKLNFKLRLSVTLMLDALMQFVLTTYAHSSVHIHTSVPQSL